MISIDLRLRNPFRCKDFRNFWNHAWQISTHKFVELQFSHYAFNWLAVEIDLNWRQTDHAGPWITLNLFGYTMDLRIVDSRHWNDETNTWQAYESS